MTLAQLIRLLQSSVCFGTVIMYGSIGEILTDKSGNLNPYYTDGTYEER